MDSSTHIIGRQKVSVRYRGRTDTQNLRDMVHRICRTELPARLTQLLDRLDTPSESIRIPKIEVALSLNDDGRIEEKLGRALIDEIEKILRRQLNDHSTEKHPAVQSFARAFALYLNEGFLPWWSPVKEAPEIMTALNEVWRSDESILQFWKSIEGTLKNPAAQSRFQALIDLKILRRIFEATALIHPETLDEFFGLIHWLKDHFHSTENEVLFHKKLESILLSVALSQKAQNEISQHFYLKLMELIHSIKTEHGNIQIKKIPSLEFQKIYQSAREADFNKEIIQNKKRDLMIEDDLEKEIIIQKQKGDPSTETKGISIQNAGLILIAPYLPRFFTNLGLIEDNTISTPSKAILILRKLVFQNEPFVEFDLVLEKLLCGIPLRESVSPDEISEINFEEQADELLRSVIEHWSVLKNTSVDGLRQGFLQREGRLSETDKHWELEVQKESYDLLLEHVPWNFRMIKLPWMEKLLQVSWG